jgi:hypothetical protein
MNTVFNNTTIEITKGVIVKSLFFTLITILVVYI